MHNLLNIGQLFLGLIGRGLKVRGHHEKLVVVGEKNLPHPLGEEKVRNAAADQAVVGDYMADAGHCLQFILHLSELAVIHRAIQNHDMLRCRLKVLFQLLVRAERGESRGQRAGNLIVDVGVFLRVIGRHERKEEEDNPEAAVAQQPAVKAREIREQGSVLVLLDRVVKDEEEAGQNHNHADNADHDALCHDNAHVASHREAHRTEREEARYRCERTAGERGKGRCDGVCHGLPLVRIFFFFLLIAVIEEDRVVDGHAELQDGRDCLGDIGNLTEEDVAAHIVEDGHADICEQQKGHDIGFETQEQHGQHQNDGDDSVNRQL